MRIVIDTWDQDESRWGYRVEVWGVNFDLDESGAEVILRSELGSEKKEHPGEVCPDPNDPMKTIQDPPVAITQEDVNQFHFARFQSAFDEADVEKPKVSVQRSEWTDGAKTVDAVAMEWVEAFPVEKVIIKGDEGGKEEVITEPVVEEPIVAEPIVEP